MDSTDPATRHAIDALDRVCENPTPSGPVTLEGDYLRWIAHIESLPRNQSGVDKSAVEAAWLEWVRHYRSSVRRDT